MKPYFDPPPTTGKCLVSEGILEVMTEKWESIQLKEI